jgi:predicted DNA-binding transcriptional regulator AlpA
MQDNTTTSRVVYHAKDIRDLTGLSLPKVYELMNRADFPTIKVGIKRKIVPIDAFHRWLDEQATNK